MRLLQTVALGVTGALLTEISPAFAQVIPEGKCAVIAASRPSLSEAQQWVSQNPSFSAKAIIKYSNGQYAVTLGLIDKVNWRDSVASFISEGQAPTDAYCSAKGAESLAWIAKSSPQPGLTQPSVPHQPLPEPEPPEAGRQSGQVTTALLLFDGETGSEFVGCLNCSKYDNGSVCNKYGDYGSPYSSTSIWNNYGEFGSQYEENSPWNRYGEGLRIVDTEGNYYGRLSLAYSGRSRLELAERIIAAYEAMENLEALRDLLCE